MSTIGITREDFQGDFLGFTFNGRHSSEFGLVRTSSSNRYNENILPTMQDKVVDVPGGHGKYYFGSYYKEKKFPINVSFDSMSQEQFDGLANWLGDGGIHELKFDESNYKAYNAKCTGQPILKYLCFEVKEDGVDKDVYKGEGTFEFTAYFPFAHSDLKIQSNNEITAGLGSYSALIFMPNWLKLLELNQQTDFDIFYSDSGNDKTSYIVSTYNQGVSSWGKRCGSQIDDQRKVTITLYPFNNINFVGIDLIGSKIDNTSAEDTRSYFLVVDSSLDNSESSSPFLEAFKVSNCYKYFVQIGKIIKGQGTAGIFYFDQPEVLSQPSDWQLALTNVVNNNIIEVSYKINNQTVSYFKFKPVINTSISKNIYINSNNQLIFYNNEIKNNWITEGDFFKIPSQIPSVFNEGPKRNPGQFYVTQNGNDDLKFEAIFQYLYY